MPHNISIQRTLPLHLSYVKQSQSLPKPSSATAAPFVPFSSPTSPISKSKPPRNSTIKITPFTLRKSPELLATHNISFFLSQLKVSIRIAKTRPITQRTQTNASGGSELRHRHSYSPQACVKTAKRKSTAELQW